MATPQYPDETNYSTICEGLSAWLSQALYEDPEALTREETLQLIEELFAKGDPEIIDLMKTTLQKPPQGSELNHLEIIAIEFTTRLMATMAKTFSNP